MKQGLSRKLKERRKRFFLEPLRSDWNVYPRMRYVNNFASGENIRTCLKLLVHLAHAVIHKAAAVHATEIL